MSIIELRSKLVFSKCLILACFFSQLATTGSGQNQNEDTPLKNYYKNGLGFQIGTGVMPKGQTKVNLGSYELYTKPSSFYSLGLTYKWEIGSQMHLVSGLNFTIVKNNFFGKIPDEDLLGIGVVRYDDSPPSIYYKGAYPKIGIPFLIQWHTKVNNESFYEFGSGLSFNYSGFSSDERIFINAADSNNTPINIFNTNFESNNEEKPWLGIVITIGKSWFLKNSNIVSLSMFGELNKARFLTMDYEITIPTKPISMGNYKISNVQFGISIQYFLTGKNKRLVRTYQKKPS